MSSGQRVPSLVMVLGLLFAGCLGDVPEPPEPGVGDADGEGPVADANTTRLMERLAPWSEDEEVLREPSRFSLGEFVYEEAPFGAIRLLNDGRAGFLVVDARIRSLPDGVVAFARIFDAAHGQNVALGAGQVDPDGASAVEMPSRSIFRYGNSYAYEVLLIAPEERPADGGVPDPADLGGNTTVLHEWSGTWSFQPDWVLAFDGPEEGTDRPDLLEDSVPEGPATGTYTMRIDGERIGAVDVLMEFADSQVVASEPETYSNGTGSVAFFLDGARPLEAYLDKLPDRGLEQSFEMRVEVDYQTRNTLADEENQRFFLTALVGYRFGGHAYVAGHDGRDLDVRIVNQAF